MGERSMMLVTLLIVLGFAGLWQQASAEGCFWISTCQNLWLGGCPNGFVAVESSKDCRGYCASPQYPTCPPLSTRFECCGEGKARESTKCSGCPNKLDIGHEWVCCSDCSAPFITDAKSKTGYCQTDAHLNFQRKPRELFKWTTGDWQGCFGKCQRASRTREVKCLRYVETAPQLPVVVHDHKCMASHKPPSQKPCIPERCVTGRHKRQGFPTWATVLISLIVVAGVGGLVFMGYIIYKRRTDNDNHGFVYVMLDNY